ncbi:MAG: response regulator [Lachnospiraceae bacterium]|nr:response regulator [Lachnospiraceae bacterium]
MQTLTGLYIEDEPKNITLMQGRFSLFPGIKLIGVDKYPQTLNGFYDFVVENEVDFLLIDHELEKASVNYKGIEVLREIRGHDSNIYAILLTNYPLEDYRDELGEYDYQLNKAELKDTKKMNELIAKIRRACALRKDNNTLSYMSEKNEELKILLRQISEVAGKEK